MEVLEQIHLENPKKFYINERKVKNYARNSVIFGGHKCGKSFIILNHLFEYKKEEFLYIDFDDIRVVSDISFESCVEFCKQKNIQILAIENCNFTPFPVNGLEIIIGSNKPISVENFEKIQVLPLDFEEFISFSQKQDEPSHIFSLFLRDGNLPQKVGKNEFSKLKITQETISTISTNATKQKLFLYMCQNGGLKLTLLLMYNSLKGSTKISKDSLYKFAGELEEEGAVYFVEKFGQLNGAKKIYLYDFSMIAATTYKKEPHRVFENMVFLELAKQNQEIYYDDGIDFLMADNARAVIARAFATKEAVASKMSKLIRRLQTYEIELLEIVTMGSEFAFEYEGVSVEALPFWVWALKD